MRIIDKFPKLIEKVNSDFLRSLVENVEAVDFNGPSTEIEKEFSVVIANSVETRRALGAFENPKVQHLIQTDRKDFFRELITSCMIIKRMDRFWDDPIPYFISNFEGETNYASFFRSASYSITSTEEQATLLKNLRKFLTESPLTKPCWASVLLIADELLANAFFNAPIDGDLKPINKAIPRSGSIKLDRPVRFFISHDRSRLMVGCEDPFGSVKREELMRKLGRDYQNQAVKIDINDVSAGLGCKMMIDNSAGFYLLVKNLKKTLVFCTLELGRPDRETVDTSKHIHLSFWS